jgi:hypothetical protein
MRDGAGPEHDGHVLGPEARQRATDPWAGLLRQGVDRFHLDSYQPLLLLKATAGRFQSIS